MNPQSVFEKMRIGGYTGEAGEATADAIPHAHQPGAPGGCAPHLRYAPGGPLPGSSRLWCSRGTPPAHLQALGTAHVQL